MVPKKTNKPVKKQNLAEMKDFFYKELSKKDELISKLNKEKEMIMKTALKQAMRVRELEEELSFFKKAPQKPAK